MSTTIHPVAVLGPVLSLGGEDSVDTATVPSDARAGVVELYRAHHRSLVRLAALVAPDPALAEDLVQEAFLRLHRQWRRVEPDRALAYVRVTIVNLARGSARRMAVAHRHSSRSNEDAASAEDLAIGQERCRAIRVALRTLSPRQRECLVRRHYLGLTESQIAAELGISIGSVRKHAQRGMAALDKQLGALR